MWIRESPPFQEPQALQSATFYELQALKTARTMIIIPIGRRVREFELMIDTRTYIDASNVHDDDKPTIWFSGIHPLAGWQSAVISLDVKRLHPPTQHSNLCGSEAETLH